MAYDFRVGGKYRRRDVYRVIGIDENTRGGNWDTGYNRFGDDCFIFCNIGSPGRTGHDYQNQRVGDRLHWFGKRPAKLTDDSIQRMIGPRGDVYVFYRNDNQDAFTFAGLGTAESTEDSVPVKVVWTLRPVG